ncbi:MAG TPA: PH domain-containing protein [Candidatus Saccharimonadales bacterium]|nr:PH domain-containing protein [Candidatus Saccharimonadales bacterium]
MDDEKIIAAAPGRYFSGFALMVATDQRLLLIDKRTFFMTVEDTRYDMISEIDFSSRMFDVTVHIYTLNKQHNFTSVKFKHQLRNLCSYVQQRVWEMRQMQDQSGQRAMPAPAAAAEPQAQSATPQPASPPLATTTVSSAPQSFHLPHVSHPAKPHLPQHIGFAAMNGSRRYTPNVYTSHLTAMRNRSYSVLD